MAIAKSVFSIFSLWFVLYLYSCTPHRWTSVKRVVQETYNRAMFPLVAINPLISVDGTLFDLNVDELLPMESVPPAIEIPYGTPTKVAYETLKSAWEKQDTIVIWKGFMKGKMDKYMDEEFLRKTLNNDRYYFLSNFSNKHYEHLALQDEAMDRMEELYLGFSYTLLKNNKDTLLADFNNMLLSAGEDVLSLVPVNKSLHHAFLYKGKKYHTGMHQAPISDWFFQVSNSKTWRFIQPKYTPYMRPITFDGVSMMSAFDYLPDNTRIPYLDVTTEPGDMMFFPAHWWHEVHNNADDFGLAFGFRPSHDLTNAMQDILLPFQAHAGLSSHRLAFLTALLRDKMIKFFDKDLVTTENEDGGVKGRQGKMKNGEIQIQKYVPGWTWNKMSGKDWATCRS